MRSLLPILVASLVGLVHGTPAPQVSGPVAQSGGGGGGGPGEGGGGEGGQPAGGGGATGGEPPVITGSGIPNVANATNPACVAFYGVRDNIMGGLFQGRCTDIARAAIRLSFHDAGTFSQELEDNALPNGGPDGSMLIDPTEVMRSENNGLQQIVSLLQPIVANWSSEGVTAADVVQLAGILGVLACPGGPKITFWTGRPGPRNISPTGLLPSPEGAVPDLIARFNDMGLTTRQMVALIGAHTSGKQQFVNPAQANSTFDTTVDIWDTRFYTQTAAAVTEPGTLKLDSDVNFAGNVSTSADFNRYIGQQNLWIADYGPAHEAMSVLGLNTRDLTDCSEILPLSIDLATVEDVTTGAAGGGGEGGGGGGNAGGSGGGGGGSNSPVTDPPVDPVKLEAAIQQFRSIWLVPGTVTT